MELSGTQQESVMVSLSIVIKLQVKEKVKNVLAELLLIFHGLYAMELVKYIITQSIYTYGTLYCVKTVEN
jgi:hypothetical protein